MHCKHQLMLDPLWNIEKSYPTTLRAKRQVDGIASYFETVRIIVIDETRVKLFFENFIFNGAKLKLL